MDDFPLTLLGLHEDVGFDGFALVLDPTDLAHQPIDLDQGFEAVADLAPVGLQRLGLGHDAGRLDHLLDDVRVLPGGRAVQIGGPAVGFGGGGDLRGGLRDRSEAGRDVDAFRGCGTTLEGFPRWTNW